MNHTPVWVHRVMTKEKIRRLGIHLMTEDDLLLCEKDMLARERIVNQYKAKFPKQIAIIHSLRDEVFVNNPNARAIKDKDSVSKEIDFLYFGYGFNPDEYFFFDLGGINKDAHRRRALVSDGERGMFRFSVNDFTESLLSDKAETFMKFKNYYKRNGVVIDKHAKYEEYLAFFRNHAEFVEKAVNSSRGQAVRLVQTTDIGDPKTYYDDLSSKGKFLLEERLVQSELLNTFGTSINNIRISTFNTKHGLKAVCGFFTMSRQGTFVVNATIGCVFAAIDCKTGEICSDGCDEYGNRFEIHPDYGVKIRGFCLPEWDEAIALCKEIAAQMPNIKYISFDLAHTTKGWDVIEMNPSGQFLHQAGTLEGFKEELKELIKDMDQIVPYAFERN